MKVMDDLDNKIQDIDIDLNLNEFCNFYNKFQIYKNAFAPN
jgi:hypothetical protein